VPDMSDNTFSSPYFMGMQKLRTSTYARYEIDQQILADTVKNTTNLIRFIKNIGLHNEVYEKKNKDDHIDKLFGIYKKKKNN
jgi:hypothetical protein